MEVEWNPEKEARSLVKHGISFAAVARVLESGTTIEFQPDRSGEPRWVAIGTHPATQKSLPSSIRRAKAATETSRREGHVSMKKRNTRSTSGGGHRKGPSEDKLVRTRSAELSQMEDRSEWERVDALTDVDIERAIADDPDAAPVLDEAFWRNAEILDPRHEKTTITMRVDDDVVQFFRRGGSGYQSRMNAVLRAYVYARRGGAR
jgi:uncharacterized protein (DUF4415 family)/uncharacterized DUF497 family protein